MTASHQVVMELGKRFCEIDPGDLFVRVGDTVTFTNGTGGLLRIFFGGKELFEVDLIDLRPDASVQLTVKPSQEPPKSFQYAVYSETRRAFGVGGSNPRIIVLR